MLLPCAWEGLRRKDIAALARMAVVAAFVGGWLFNFVYDVKFMSGFVSGWLSHGFASDVLDWLQGLLS